MFNVSQQLFTLKIYVNYLITYYIPLVLISNNEILNFITKIKSTYYLIQPNNCTFASK